MKSLFFAVALLITGPALTQPIPGSKGWLATPTQRQKPAAQPMSPLDAALVRCYRAVIATGQYFLDDVNYVLVRCEQPLNAWTAGCEQREGRGAAICLLGPQQAVGEALQDAWAHRNNLKGWLASLPPLPGSGPRQRDLGGIGSSAPRSRQSIGSK